MKNILMTYLMALFSAASVSGQPNELVVRMAKLGINSAQLENYKAAMKEHAETAIQVEPAYLPSMPFMRRIIQHMLQYLKYMPAGSV